MTHGKRNYADGGGSKNGYGCVKQDSFGTWVMNTIFLKNLKSISNDTRNCLLFICNFNNCFKRIFKLFL
jgi:hypothetical protein